MFKQKNLNYKLEGGRTKKSFFLPAFVARILTPRPRKSGYGLLLGCGSQLDAGREKNHFLLAMFEKII